MVKWVSATVAANVAVIAADTTGAATRSDACRERQELDRLPTEIDNLSASKAAFETRLASLSQQHSKENYQQAADIGLQLASLEAKIDAKTDRWLELEDRAEQ